MNNDRLQQIWEKYSNSIPDYEIKPQNLEKMLSSKFKRTLGKLSFQSVSGFFIILFVPGIVYGAFYKTAQHKQLYFFFGLILLLSVLWYLRQQILFYRKIKDINIASDSIAELEEKLLKLKIFGLKMQKDKSIISYIALSVPFMYITAEKFYTTSALTQILVYSVSVAYLTLIYMWSRIKNKRFFDDRINILLEELNTLKSNNKAQNSKE